MQTVDIGKIIRARAPKASRFIPGFIFKWLERVIHQKDINHMLTTYAHSTPQEFIHGHFSEHNITYSAIGLDKIDKSKRYIFAANHPFGGTDGMMISDLLISHFGDSRAVVNDFLMHVTPLRPLWIPINKHGAQNSQYAKMHGDAFMGDLPILTFPAGLCSRKNKQGVLEDTPWKNNFVKRAKESDRLIVPVFVEGELSKSFYRLDRISKFLRLKISLAMIRLPHETFTKYNKHYRIVFGEPITQQELQEQGGYAAQVKYVRKKAYSLQEVLKNCDK